VLTVKENQEHLLEDIQERFEEAFAKDFARMEHDSWEKPRCLS
jgi:hypothetical protein